MLILKGLRVLLRAVHRYILDLSHQQ